MSYTAAPAEPILTPEERFSRFVAEYSNYFGKFPITDPEELSDWEELVEDIPSDRISEFLTLAFEIWPYRGKPNLQFFEDCLTHCESYLEGEINLSEKCYECGKPAICQLCNGTGMIPFIHENSNGFRKAPCVFLVPWHYLMSWVNHELQTLKETEHDVPSGDEEDA